MGEYGYLPERLRSHDAVSLSSTDVTVHQRILKTLSVWVEQHPNPDAPALAIAGLGAYSPRQLMEAVSEKSETGQFFEALIVNGARAQEDGLEGVLRSFREESGGSGSSGINAVLTLDKPE
jgi:hypothetical protein